MSRALITNNRGEIEVDPFDHKGRFNIWLKSISLPGGYDYFTLMGISRQHSQVLTRYVLELAAGKNTARGHRKGPRSYGHLISVRNHLRGILIIFERQTSKFTMDFTEDDVLAVFSGLRLGTIKSQRGMPYLDVSTYAKGFCAFWRWHMRVQLLSGLPVIDVVQNLDTSPDHKPVWHHFTLKDVERMADIAPYFEYKALMYFLFDSGIRAPKEMMNVRVMDLSPIPDSSQLHLTIRHETSKTFGRKIKLMLCSEIIKKYIDNEKLKGADFLFSKSPIVYNRVLAKLGHKILGVGTPRQQRLPNGDLHKTLIRHGITMYDFRHNSVCHYLPIYKSENQLKYRYGWKKTDMIVYYSEYIGMKDTITEEDMLIDTSKTELEKNLAKEQQKVNRLEEQFEAQKIEMEDRMKKLEAKLFQQYADSAHHDLAHNLLPEKIRLDTHR